MNLVDVLIRIKRLAELDISAQAIQSLLLDLAVELDKQGVEDARAEQSRIAENAISSERRRRYIQRRGIDDHEWNALRLAIFERDGYKCQYCERDDGQSLHCDHYIPLYLGGTNSLDNLKTACNLCNSSKSGKHPSEWKGRP